MTGRTANWRIFLWVVIALMTLWFLWAVRSVLLPFILALVISAILDPAVKKLVSRGWKKSSTVALVLIAFFGTLLVLGIALTPMVTSQLAGLKDKGDKVIASVTNPNPLDNFFLRGNPENRVRMDSQKDPVDEALSQYSSLLSRANLPTTKRAWVAQYIEPQREQIVKAVESAVKSSIGMATSLVSQLIPLIFVPLLVALILPNTDEFKRKLVMLIPPQLRRPTVDLTDDIGDVFSNYLRGVAIAVFGYMAFMAMLLSLLGAPYGLLLGALFGAIYLIPYLNVVISSTTLVLVTVLSGKQDWLTIHFSSPWAYAGVLVVSYVACHFVFDMIVYPRFVGNAVGLHPIVSMFVIFSGGALFGLPGMILAFPVAGSIKVILDRLLAVTNKTERELILPELPLRHRDDVTG